MRRHVRLTVAEPGDARVVEAELRLALWYGGRWMRSAPDLVEHDGVVEQYGTQGGIGYSFTSGDWLYLVERIDMCEVEDECGPFMSVMRAGKLVRRYQCSARK